MKDFIKKFFCTRYRIYPVYQENRQVGFIVYEKAWLSPIWTAATLDVIDENGQLENKRYAIFSKDTEAKNFIMARTQSYDYETIHSIQ